MNSINQLKNSMRQLIRALNELNKSNISAETRGNYSHVFDPLDSHVHEVLRMLEYEKGMRQTNGLTLPELLEGLNHASLDCRQTNGRYEFFSRNRHDGVIISMEPLRQEEDGVLLHPFDAKELDDLLTIANRHQVKREIYTPDSNGRFHSNGTFVLDVQRSKDISCEVWISLIVMQANGWQRYDRMYILDSLSEDDNTAFHLEEQVKQYHHLGKDFCRRIKVTTIEQWNAAIETIIRSARHNSVPILHLEIHGTHEGDLHIGESIVKMSEFMKSVEEVSQRCNAKVLVTLAVCEGLTFFKQMENHFGSLPCSYVIGSTDLISSGNLQKRYSEFYRYLLQDSTTKVDILRAFQMMQQALKNSPSDQAFYRNEKFVMMKDNQTYE